MRCSISGAVACTRAGSNTPSASTHSAALSGVLFSVATIVRMAMAVLPLPAGPDSAFSSPRGQPPPSTASSAPTPELHTDGGEGASFIKIIATYATLEAAAAAHVASSAAHVAAAAAASHIPASAAIAATVATAHSAHSAHRITEHHAAEQPACAAHHHAVAHAHSSRPAHTAHTAHAAHHALLRILLVLLGVLLVLLGILLLVLLVLVMAQAEEVVVPSLLLLLLLLLSLSWSLYLSLPFLLRSGRISWRLGVALVWLVPLRLACALVHVEPGFVVVVVLRVPSFGDVWGLGVHDGN